VMAPILLLFLFLVGMLGPVTGWQWREGRWLPVAHWIARRLSPQFIAGVPMAGVLVMAIGLSLVWPPGIILAFLAAAGFLWALFAVAQPSEAPRARAGREPDRSPTPPRAAAPRPPGRRTVSGRPQGSSRPRPRST
jgi:hypothetical protein